MDTTVPFSDLALGENIENKKVGPGKRSTIFCFYFQEVGCHCFLACLVAASCSCIQEMNGDLRALF